MLYLTIKWLHILLAIAAIGANLTYSVWIARAARSSPETLSFTLKGVKILESWVAHPAYTLLLVTGVGMVVISGLKWPLVRSSKASTRGKCDEGIGCL